MCYRDYFGEKTGIYFAWLGRCLCTLYVYHILGAGNNMICILEKKKTVVKSTMSTVSYRIILKYLIFDLAHHKTPTVRWSERPTDILEGHGFDFCWVLRKFFFQVYQLQTPLCYLHFI